jgi:hypothetical protein
LLCVITHRNGCWFPFGGSITNAATGIDKISDGFFLGLQTDYELMQRHRQIRDRLKAIKPRAA